MKFTTPARRLLAAGAVSALAAGTLVATTATTASAAPISNDYICEGSTGPFPMNLSSDIPILAAVPEIGAGFDVPAEFLEVQNTVTVPTAVINGLAGLGITRVEAPDFAGTFGPVSVGVDGVGANVADAVDNGNGTSSLTADGFNAPFEVPAAGTYDVVSPTTVDLVAKNSAGTAVANVPCVLADGETAGAYATDVAVLKNDSTSNAKPTKRQFKKGTAAAVRVKVTGSEATQTPGGKVLLKKGTKTLAKGNLNDNGVVVLKTKALRVGKTKLKTVYKGDGYTKPSTDTVVVKVVR
jgi:hypothetical protein